MSFMESSIGTIREIPESMNKFEIQGKATDRATADFDSASEPKSQMSPPKRIASASRPLAG